MSDDFTAEKVAVSALKRSIDINYESPFAKRAKKYGLKIKGGKQDDITVIISQIIIDGSVDKMKSSSIEFKNYQIGNKF